MRASPTAMEKADPNFRLAFRDRRCDLIAFWCARYRVYFERCPPEDDPNSTVYGWAKA
jgi:hypothetical protein